MFEHEKLRFERVFEFKDAEINPEVLGHFTNRDYQHQKNNIIFFGFIKNYQDLIVEPWKYIRKETIDNSVDMETNINKPLLIQTLNSPLNLKITDPDFL